MARSKNTHRKSNEGKNRISRLIATAVRSTLEMLEERRLFANPVAAPGGPYSVAEGSSVMISGLASTDDGSIASYSWDTNYSAGRGFRARFTGPTWRFNATDSGTRAIALRVTDDQGNQTTQTGVINISDVAPTISLSAPNNVAEGQSFNITWSHTDPGASDAVTAWEVDWGDDTTTTLAGSATGASHSYIEDDNFVITLTATQADGDTSVTHNIVVNNELPTVAASTTTPSVDEGDTVDLAFSTPNRASSIEGWIIEWGDGSVDNFDVGPSTASHVYTDNGTYTATISALEPDGGSGSATVQYTVGNVIPTIAITGTPGTGTEGSQISVGSTLSDPSTDDTHTYGWTVYRGGTHYILPGGVNITNTTFAFTPTDNGSYVIRLTVQDDDGGSRTVNSDPIIVANAAPTGSITGAPVGAIDEGDTVSLTAVPADAGSEDTFSYAWSVTKGGSAYTLPGGTNTTSAGFTFVPRDNGSYIATVVITDDDTGTVSVSTAAITVNNVTPGASISGAPGTADEGDTIETSAVVTDDGADDTHTYSWSVQKLTGGGNGTLTMDGTDYGEMGNYDFADTTTITTRMLIDSTMSNGTGYLFNRPIGGLKVGFTKSGNDVQFFVDDDQGNTVTAPLNATSLDTTFDLAVSFDATTGAVEFYVDGSSVVTTGSIAVSSLFSEHTHFGQSAKATFDQVSVYNSILTVQDIADLHAGDPIIANPVDNWEFGEASNATTATSNGTNAETISLSGGFTFSGVASWTTFTLPNGTDTNESTFSFVPTDNGSYRVLLTVTDDDNASVSTQTSTITVANVAPTGSILGVASVVEGASPFYIADVSDAGSLDTLTYLWSVEKDGNTFVLPGGTDVDESSFSFVPTDNGAYVVSVVVTDNDGASITRTYNTTVTNAAPVVVIDNVPSTGNEGSAINVSSTVTDAGDDDVLTYGWTVYRNGQHFVLPGNVVLTGTSFTFTPTDDGSYVIRLTVQDDDTGSTTVNSDPVIVGNVAPTANITGTPVGSIEEGDTVSLTANPSDAGSEDTFTYAWSVTKGGSAYTLPGGTNTTSAGFTFVPRDNGSYVATVVVTDDNSGTVSVSTAAITVDNVDPVVGLTGVVGTADEGDTITLGSTKSDVGADDTHTYLWSVEKDGNAFVLPGGTVTNASGFSFVPTDNGTYVVSLLLTDDDSGTSIVDSGNIVVSNVAPTGVVTGDSTGDEGETLNYSVAVSDDGSADTHTYLWSVEKDGNAFVLPGGTTVNASTFAFVPTDNGAYVVSVVVTDDDAGTNTYTHNVTVANVAPDVLITGTPSSENEGTAITVGTTVTDDGVNDTFSYAWSVTKNGAAFTLPGGHNTTSAGFTFTPTDNGAYRISVAVTDNDTATTTVQSSEITVNNVAPTVTIAGEPGGSIAEGTAVNLTSVTTDPSTVDTFTYAWTITKNGVAYVPGVTTNTSSLSFTPNDNGTFVATLTVTDDDTGTSHTDSLNIVVTNANPGATITGTPVTSVNEGTAISVGSSITDAGTADTHTYLWSVSKDGNAFTLPGGTIVSAATFSFTPTDNGDYVIGLVVTDDDTGSVTVDSGSITVANVAPAPTISGNASVNEASPITLTATPNDVGSADTHTYSWSVTKNGNAYNLPGGTVTNAASFTFTPAAHGAYVATVTVTDDDTGSATQTHAITVNNLPPAVSITGTPVGVRAEGSDILLTSLATDPGGDVSFTYAWTVRKGGVLQTLPGGTVTNASTFTFTPTDNGTYTVSVAVTDSGGATGTATTANMVITNALPLAIMTGQPGGSIGEGTAVNLTVAAEDPGADDMFTYAWTVTKNGSSFTLPGGTVTNASTFGFTPTDNGTYIATCVVTDDDGGPTSVASGAITVTNVNPVAGITGTPGSNVNEGTAISVGSTVTDAGSADTHTYAWSVTKDGSSFTLPGGVATNTSSFSFVPTDNGAYVINLTVTDDDSGINTVQSSTVTVVNVAPVPTIAGNSSVNEGSSITVTASPNDAGSADTHTYSWSVTKDGNAYTLPGGTVTNTASFTFTPAPYGAYVASVVVTDDDGSAVTATKSITVNNVAPTVSITGMPVGNSNEGTNIVLTANAADVGGSSLTYAWTVTRNGASFTLPGGTVTNASTLTLSPTDNGTYVATCVVTDPGSLTGTANSGNMVVVNVNPTATITGQPGGSIAEGTAVSLTAVPADVASEDTFTYAWTVTKNGSAYTLPGGTVTNTAGFSFTPNDNGTYVATCVVSDDDAGSVNVASSAITVTNVAPTATIGGVPSQAQLEGLLISLTSSILDAGTADTHTYAWSVTKNGNAFTLPNGAATTGNTFGFTPTDNGSYVVSLTVTDDDTGAVTVTSGAITINNANPTGSISGPTSVNEGDTVDLTATVADAGSADTHTYAWSVTKSGNSYALPGGTITNAAAFSFTPVDNGSYIITCVVADDDGGSVNLQHSLAVGNVAPVANIIGESSAVEGDTLDFGLSVLDVGASDSHTYTWSVLQGGTPITLPGGTVLDSTEFSFITTDNGTFTVQCIVTDNDGGTVTAAQNVIISNVEPEVAITGAPAEADEGTEINLGSTVTDASSADTEAGFTYLWTVTRGGNTVATGEEAEFDFTPNIHGVYTVTLAVSDKDEGTTTTSATTITVNNVAPSEVAIDGMPDTMPESEVATLTASASDAAGDTITYTWDITRNGSPFATETGQFFEFSPHARGEFDVTLTATDSAGAETSTTSSITVDNIAPEAEATLPTAPLLLGEAANFTLSIDDVPPTQGMTVTWDFGDGTSTSNVYTGDQSALTASHVYTTAGNHDVTITISDGVDETVIEGTVVVTRTAVRTDLVDPTKTALFVIGTSSADTILVEPGSTSGNWKVTLNGVVQGSTFAPTARTVIYGNGGSNNITVTGGLNAQVYAGTTNSTVTTGGGNDIIFGSPGADSLDGGTGRDIVIGGAGRDTVVGGESEDAVVADNVNWTGNYTAIGSVLTTWGSNKTLAARITDMKATGLFSGTRLIADAIQDQTYGGARADWFVVNTAVDRIRDLQPLDVVN